VLRGTEYGQTCHSHSIQADSTLNTVVQQKGNKHRRTSQGAAAPPPDSGKTIIFRAKAKFFGQKPAAKNEKYIFVYIKRKRRNSFHL